MRTKTKSVFSKITRRDFAFISVIVRLFQWILESPTATLTDKYFWVDFPTTLTTYKDARFRKYTIRKIRSGVRNFAVIERNFVAIADRRTLFAQAQISTMILAMMQTTKSYPSKVLRGFVPVLGYINDFQHQAIENVVNLNEKSIINVVMYGLGKKYFVLTNVESSCFKIDISLWAIHNGVMEIVNTDGDIFWRVEVFDQRKSRNEAG